jgi:rfaE bifunctional protein kinase chain/domain
MSGKDILLQFENLEIMIVGDVMVDRYLTGSVHRISPEAPVPVVHHHQTENRLGGAANVALNIRALGGIPVLCSVIGQDDDSQVLTGLMTTSGFTDEGMVRSAGRCTTVKTRVLGNQQQMLRIDREDTHDLDPEESDTLLERIKRLLDARNIRVIIFQDYNKGVLTAGLIEAVLRLASERGIQTAVDPKLHNFFAYKGVDLFKPNLKEVRESVPFQVQPEPESLQKASRFLREKLQNKMTMLTLSEKGLFLEDGKNAGRLFPTIPRTIADVSGAGDTVISIASLGLAAGLDLETIALLSNLAGGQVCEFPGVVPVRRDLLEKEYDQTITQKTLP